MLEFGLVQKCPSRLSGEKGGVYIPALCPPIFLLLPNDFAPFPLSFFLTFLWFPFAIQSAIRSTNRHASLAFRLGHVLERAVPETQKWRRLGLVPLPRTTEFPKQSVRITFIWSGASGRAKAFHPNRAKATGHDSFDGPRLAGGAEPVWSLVPFLPALHPRARDRASCFF